MITNYSPIRKTAAIILWLFPALMMLGLTMHFSSVHTFLNFQFSRDVYDGGKLFDVLVAGKGHAFVMAHSIIFLSLPLFFIVIFTLGWVLYQEMPKLAIAGVITGVLGCTAMAAVFGAWLSFTGIATVNAVNYAGARAGFIELVRMKGMLKLFSITSYLSFISIMLLAAGLIRIRKFNPWSMLCILIGSLLFVAFMDQDNWMFIGSLLLLIGFIPLGKSLKTSNA